MMIPMMMLSLLLLLLSINETSGINNNNRNDIGSYQDKSYNKKKNSGGPNSTPSSRRSQHQYDQHQYQHQQYAYDQASDYRDPRYASNDLRDQSMYDNDTPPSSSSSSSIYEGNNIRKRRNDIVQQYMSSAPSKLIVTLSSFASYYLLSSFLLKMIFSKSSQYLSLCIAFLSSLSCFITGNFAEFTKALGVCMILIIRRAKIGIFFTLFFKQMASATMLSKRKPFPPAENPWKYSPRPDTNDIEFSMIRVIMATVLFGGIVGSVISGPIPLFPGWLGALIGAAGLGFIATTHDSRGDLIRYIGWALNDALGDVLKAAADVHLYDKSSIVLSNAFAFGNKLDQKYKVLEKVKAIITMLISTIMKTFSKVKSDYEAANS